MSLPATLYRALLHNARVLDQPLRVRLPVHLSQVQWMRPNHPQYQFLPADAASTNSALEAVFPGVDHPAAQKDEIEKDELIAIIRAEFRKPVSSGTLPKRLDDGITVLREMHYQVWQYQ